MGGMEKLERIARVLQQELDIPAQRAVVIASRQLYEIAGIWVPEAGASRVKTQLKSEERERRLR